MSDLESAVIKNDRPEAAPAAADHPLAAAAKSGAEVAPADPEHDLTATPADQQKEEKKRNRTKEFIERQNRKIAELYAELESERSRRAAVHDDGGPKPEDYEFDTAAYTRALLQHELKQREAAETEKRRAAEQQEKVLTYVQKVQEFAELHEDFQDVVNSIPSEYLSQELQDAIMGHERGPEIAYHIAQNDDDLFQLASIRPEMMAAAVERLAKRLTAPQPSTPAPKPITNAPRPPATVSGRSPTETPPEKLTDQQYADRERERRNKMRRR